MPQTPEDTAPLTTDPRRPPIRRSVILLALATLALVAFILLLGDVRRKNTPLAQAAWYAARLSERQGSARALPLNLDVEASPAHRPKLRRFHRLDPAEARALRRTDKRVIAAYTDRVNRVLAPDGRAVVFFDNGSFSAAWLSMPESDRLLAAQRELIQTLHDPHSDD